MRISCNNSFPCHGLTILIIFLVSIPALCFGEFQAEPCTPACLQAKTLLRRGSDLVICGRLEQAIQCLGDAAQLFEQEGRREEHTEAVITLSRAYIAMGAFRQATAILKKALAESTGLGDEIDIARISLFLGNAYFHSGAPDLAEPLLKKGILMAQGENAPGIAAALYTAIGNLCAAKTRHTEAMDLYEEGLIHAARANDPTQAARICANMAQIACAGQRFDEAAAFLRFATRESRIPDQSHDTAWLFIKSGRTFHRLAEYQPHAAPAHKHRASQCLEKALEIAELNGDHRTLSFAAGYLGQIHEKEKHQERALHLTRRALFAAQQVSAPESLYLWQWQMGRLFKGQGKMPEAISMYRDAVDTLESIRHTLTNHCEHQETGLFLESIRPVYLGLADILLDHAAALQSPEAAEGLLREARDTIELLKAAEIRDYFQDPCLDVYEGRIQGLDSISTNTAIIYMVLLEDRLELLISLGGTMKRVSCGTDAGCVAGEVRQFRRTLEKRTTREFLVHGQRLYDRLIRPLEQDLSSGGIETLVFVPDGPLRNIPMGALHDGDRFLIERFAVANVIGLTLTDPHPIRRENIRILMAGITHPIEGFSPLIHVDAELHAIARLYEGALFLNEDFLTTNISEALCRSSYTIVHIASHGEFRGDSHESCLIAWDGTINLDDLDHLLSPSRFRKDPVELLTLSACETAAGDDRAALGLAGVAVRAGARSALATLWHVDDQASCELIVEFYRQLKDHALSKAMALRKAQLKMLNDQRYMHPCYWSPFLMIGNWL